MAATISAPCPVISLHVQSEPFHASDPREAIGKLATTFARQVGMTDSQPLIHSALQREASESTYLGKGLALPHARIKGLACAGICLAQTAAGIPWQGGRAHLIAFLAVPEEQPELYLHFMSHLVRWRMQLPDELLSQPLPPAAEWEAELRKALAL